MTAALDRAIATNFAHGAMACDDPLTDCLISQCTQPADLVDYAEGQHPAQLAADDAVSLPAGWPWLAAAILAATWLFSHLKPWGWQ